MCPSSGHTQALCSNPHFSHRLFHQIHHSLNIEAGIPTAASTMMISSGIRRFYEIWRRRSVTSVNEREPQADRDHPQAAADSHPFEPSWRARKPLPGSARGQCPQAV